MGRLPTSERPRSLSLGIGAVQFSAPCGKSIACHTDNTSGYGAWGGVPNAILRAALSNKSPRTGGLDFSPIDFCRNG